MSTTSYETPKSHLTANGGGAGLVAKSCPTLATPWTVARQAPLSMGFSRPEYWSGLPFSFPGDLSNPGVKPISPASQVDSLPMTHLGGPRRALGSYRRVSTGSMTRQVREA